MEENVKLLGNIDDREVFGIDLCSGGPLSFFLSLRHGLPGSHGGGSVQDPIGDTPWGHHSK